MRDLKVVTVLPRVIKGSIIGQRVDYNGVKVLRGQQHKPSKNWSKFSPGERKPASISTPGWERHCEGKVSCLRTTGQVSSPQTRARTTISPTEYWLFIFHISLTAPKPFLTLYLPWVSKTISPLNINTVPRRKVMRIGTVCQTVGRITNEILGVKRANR